MNRVRNISSWIAVGIFTVVLSAGVEVVSHHSFAGPGASATSVSTPSTSGATVSPATPVRTTTRVTYRDDGSSSHASGGFGGDN